MIRRTTRPVRAFAALALASLALACEPKTDPAPADAGAAAASVADEAIPTQADFDESAAEGLTPETIEAEIAKLEAELR